MKLFLKKVYTICNIYVPHTPLRKNDIMQLIHQIRTPFLLLGDMNARSSMWDMENVRIRSDDRGKIFEEILLEQNVSLLNNRKPTHYHSQTNTYSVIDLSICSSESLLDYEYEVLEYRYESDHYPVHISFKDNYCISEKPERYKVEKADWQLFSILTWADMEFHEEATVDEIYKVIYEKIIAAADMAIPKTSNNIVKPPVPWFNEECKRAITERNRAERALKRHYSVQNKICYNRHKAKCRYIFNCAKRECWVSYVSSINQYTELNKIWKKVQKISGKFSATPSPILRQGESIVTDRKQVANIFARKFATISSIESYNREFIRYKSAEENQQLQMGTNNHQMYNEPITEKEFQTALNSTKESAPGHDLITYSMIKSVHSTMKGQIVKLFNRIF